MRETGVLRSSRAEAVPAVCAPGCWGHLGCPEVNSSILARNVTTQQKVLGGHRTMAGRGWGALSPQLAPHAAHPVHHRQSLCSTVSFTSKAPSCPASTLAR